MDRKALFDFARPASGYTPAQVAAGDAFADALGLPKGANDDAPAIMRDLAVPSRFFGEVRKRFGPLTQPQVDGFTALLQAMAPWPVSWVAYGLATAWHETGYTMQPIKEYGGPSYFHRMYDIEGQRPAKARELGNLTPGDGARYAGRGYVQLTGKTNYDRYGLVDRPDDAMKADVAARILVDGMEKGVFTGKKLSDYLPGNYVAARKIINGTDKAEAIAGHARGFEAALIAGEWS
jgi:putative chitinase